MDGLGVVRHWNEVIKWVDGCDGGWNEDVEWVDGGGRGWEWRVQMVGRAERE